MKFMKNKKIYCFDLDNVICTTKGNNYKKVHPKKVVNFINKLYEKNYYIKIFTARYMGRNNEISQKLNVKGIYQLKNN